jgi:hypothetical protein
MTSQVKLNGSLTAGATIAIEAISMPIRVAVTRRCGASKPNARHIAETMTKTEGPMTIINHLIMTTVTLTTRVLTTSHRVESPDGNSM